MKRVGHLFERIAKFHSLREAATWEMCVMNLNPIPRLQGGEHINAVPGSLGRIQVCNWALRRAGSDIETQVRAYAAFRIRYHRGLDSLRKNGWRGSGYVRWRHESNRGFLRCLSGLARMAAAIGEDGEGTEAIGYGYEPIETASTQGAAS